MDAAGKIDTVKGTLPYGFLAIDLATSMKTNLFDPDQRAEGSRVYKRLRSIRRSRRGNTRCSATGSSASTSCKPDGSDARAIVAANGGSDLIYVPDGNRATVQRVAGLLLTFDYMGGVFVDDQYGRSRGRCR